MTITEVISEIRKKGEELGLDVEMYDDEDIIEKALILLENDLELEFNEVEGEEDEFNYNDFHELKPGDEGYVAG